jgi:hypothetical protein
MVDHLHPEFHAEVIKELYGELECYQLVTEATRKNKRIELRVKARASN